MISVYWKGKIQDVAKVRISPVNTGLFYGESLFEAIPVYHGVPFCFKEHLARLKKGCAFLKWPIPRAAEFQKGIVLFYKEMGKDFLIRFNLTQEITDSPNPRHFEVHAPALYATARPLRHELSQSEPLWGKVGISPWKASSPQVFPNHFKAAVYMTTRAIFRQHPEWQDILRLDDKGFVADGGSSTPLWFDGKKIHVAPLELGGLASVTRIKVLTLCDKNGIPVIEKSWKPAEALKKGEILMSGSGVGIMGISHINDRKLKGSGEMTRQLWHHYRTEALQFNG